jgi:surface protein
MNNMFRSLSALKELDLSCFDTSNVTDMGLMFAYCSKLEMLNLSSFNVNKVTNFKNMLWMMSTLENGKKTLVYVPNPNPFEDKNTGINNNIQQKPANSEYAVYVPGTPQ